MTDPVCIVSRALVEVGALETAGPDDARAVLADLHKAGWRIVRTERAGYVRGDSRPDEDVRLYVGASPMDGDEWLHHITDEWTPEVPS